MASRRFWSSLIWAAAVSGCAVGPEYRTPESTTPATWSGIEPAKSSTQPAGPSTRPAEVTAWWRSLNDPVLNSLVERAVQSNLDLRVAEARITEARAARGVVAADLWPQGNLGGSYTYRGGSLNTGPKSEGGLSVGRQVRNSAINSGVRWLTTVLSGGTTTPTTLAGALGQAVSTTVSNRLAGSGPTASRDQNLFQAGFDASWELDVFGGTRRAIEAADADLAASEETHRDVLVTLLSEVALNYVQLRGFQRRLAITQENIRIQQDTLELTQTRHKAGFIGKLDVAQAAAQLASTQSQVPLLKTAIKQTIYQPSVLLAKSPGALLPELEREGPIPATVPEVPIGLPSDLLRRRPDIRAAERQLAAATARIGVATADLFPKFSLTGSFGPQSRTINRMLDRQSLAWSVGPGVTWPVFDGWRIRSNIKVEDARQEQALATYEQTVLIAFQEVENALAAYTDEQVRHQFLAEAVAASQESTALSNEQYAAGFTAFLNVLDAQRTLYASQDQLVQSETTMVTNLIALYKALGGGWEPVEE